jgi:hypothetical protein
MKNSITELLESSDQLSEDAKREVASEIMKRSARFDLPPLANDSLTEAADAVFRVLDNQESNRE